MSSEFNLTKEQLAFWWNESHGEVGKPAIALIYPDGRVELDFHEEILLKFEEDKNLFYSPFFCGNAECDEVGKYQMVSDFSNPRECPFCCYKEVKEALE